MKPLRVLTALAACAAAVLAAVPATAQSPTLPQVTVTMDGKTITVGGTLESGAVDIVSTTTSRDAEPTFIRLNPGVTADQVFTYINSHPKQIQDPNTVAPFGAIVFDPNAPKGTSHVQTVLEPGDYVALDTQGPDPAKAPRTTFTVAPAPAPAALPTPTATIHMIEFGYRLSNTVRRGHLVRVVNDGYVVHMAFAIHARSHRDALRITHILRTTNGDRAEKLVRKLARPPEVNLAGPLSHGALQQLTFNGPTGYYVLACFMDTQDGREHTRLGMERVFHVI